MGTASILKKKCRARGPAGGGRTGERGRHPDGAADKQRGGGETGGQRGEAGGHREVPGKIGPNKIKGRGVCRRRKKENTMRTGTSVNGKDSRLGHNHAAPRKKTKYRLNIGPGGEEVAHKTDLQKKRGRRGVGTGHKKKGP